MSFKLKKILYLHSDGNDEGANAEQAWPGFEDVFVVDDENHQNTNRQQRRVTHSVGQLTRNPRFFAILNTNKNFNIIICFFWKKYQAFQSSLLTWWIFSWHGFTLHNDIDSTNQYVDCLWNRCDSNRFFYVWNTNWMKKLIYPLKFKKC